ncbi:MAG: OmpA family protein [Bryobacterales bacterium]|nr:OmpA family protein [Bryobacterales bacterium]
MSTLVAQGLETDAKPDDWEEINFEFDSSILSDGYPSLLRLADLLSKNSDYTVQLVGHTDFRGSDEYNLGLGRRRAETVHSFLVKYGAKDGQITVQTAGEGTPEVSNETDEGRFMNRRVIMTVRDGNGNIVSDGGVGDAIQGIERAGMSEDCCNQILEKLNKLDEILDLLNNLKAENDRLKEDVAELKGRPEPVAPPTPPTPTQVASAVRQEMEDMDVAKAGNKFASYNVNAGPQLGAGQSGNLAVSGQGRVFLPFAKRHAVQAQGEFMHWLDRDEGQVDLGLVNRWGNVQLGGFSSFKYVKFDQWQQMGGLGQAAFTADYIFNKGRVGFFGTKAFLDGAVVNETMIRRNIFEQTYLSVVDQAGVSTAFSAWNVGGDKTAWFEGNAGALFRKGGSNRFGGGIKYVHPLTQGIALTLEGGLNETLVSDANRGRVAVGLQFGGWLSPDKYKDNGDRPVPVDVPRVRYEVRTRQIQVGNDAPIADAGGDQINVEAGPINLDGSGSYDPEGKTLTYAWHQIAGKTVELTGANSAGASFTAEEGQTYQFRLTVKDPEGLMGTDRVTVSTVDRRIQILRFSADPSRVNPGEPVTITWKVENADSVNISPQLGDVDLMGTSRVTVNETTVFTLTAKSGDKTITETRTVEVTKTAPLIVSFNAEPRNIAKGESSVLSWETANADQVTIDVQEGSGMSLGSVGTAGTATVSPMETTTYKITATNQSGSVTRTVTIQVGPPGMPRILNFVATPQEIDPGEFSTLMWEVENADSVSIDKGVGPVDLSGNSDVQPNDTTTYVLTASNNNGTVTASVIVSVRRAVRILSFQANKTTVANPGDPAMLSWTTENADRVVLVNVGDQDPNGSATVNPVGTTLYTLIAYGQNSSVQAVVTINVENENHSPIAIAEAPTAILVPAGTLTGTGTLDGSKSYDPDGDPITYQWTNIGSLPVNIKNPGAAQATVEFLGGYGRYEFQLTVTDDKGLMGMDSTVVFWVDP